MNATTISPLFDVTTNDEVNDVILPLELHYYHVIYLSVAIAVGIPGNMVVIASYSTLKKKSSCDWYILYIAVLDLIICLFRVPTHLAMETGHWQRRGTDALCKIVFWLSQSVITASMFLFGFIAIDRYVKVCKHTVTITPRFSRNCILIISTVSLVSALPTLWMFANSQAGKCVVVSSLGLNMMTIFYTVLFAAFVVMFVIVVICYTCIIVKVQQTRQTLRGHSRPSTKSHTRTHTQTQTQTHTHTRTPWSATRSNRVAANPRRNDCTQHKKTSDTRSSEVLEKRMRIFSVGQSSSSLTLDEENFSSICDQLRNPTRRGRTISSKRTGTSQAEMPVSQRPMVCETLHVPALNVNVPAAAQNDAEEEREDSLIFVTQSEGRIMRQSGVTLSRHTATSGDTLLGESALALERQRKERKLQDRDPVTASRLLDSRLGPREIALTTYRTTKPKASGSETPWATGAETRRTTDSNAAGPDTTGTDAPLDRRLRLRENYGAIIEQSRSQGTAAIVARDRNGEGSETLQASHSNTTPALARRGNGTFGTSTGRSNSRLVSWRRNPTRALADKIRQTSPTARSCARPCFSRHVRLCFSRHVRLTMLLLVVTAVFVVSWVPPCVAMVWYFYVGYKPTLTASQLALQTYAPTGYVLNHFANPVLYLVFSPTFRAMLLATIKRFVTVLCRCKIR